VWRAGRVERGSDDSTVAEEDEIAAARGFLELTDDAALLIAGDENADESGAAVAAT
jgi:hypothetical protein